MASPNVQIPTVVTPPRGLTRTEKDHFREVIGMISTAGRPPTPGQIAMVADFVSCRGRVTMLQKMLRHETLAKTEFAQDKARLLKIARQLDQSAKLSVELANKLGI